MSNIGEIGALTILPADDEPKYNAKVIGIGSQGSKTIEFLASSEWPGVEFAQSQKDSTTLKLLVPDKNLKCKLLSSGNIVSTEKFLKDGDMAFIVVGSGDTMDIEAALIIAKQAKKKNLMTIGIFTPAKHKPAPNNIPCGDIEKFRTTSDISFVLPRVKQKKKTGKQADENISKPSAKDVYHVIKGITDLIQMPGLITLDIEDLRIIFRNNDQGYMGMGESKGIDRPIKAANTAILNLSQSGLALQDTKGILINISGGADMVLDEINQAILFIQDKAHEDVNIIFGAVFDQTLRDAIRVTVFASRK